MARKKKKNFSKKELFSLFQKKNYQKVISKIKQFDIEDMSEDEIRDILAKSYYKISEKNFEQGDIARALRDINSLLQIDNSIEYQLIKLKYLCYMEHFKDAIILGEELLKYSKIKKEVAFLYIMAKLYNQELDIDSKLLKSLAISKQKYILGFKALLEDNKELALDYFNASKPRAKVEKENIKAVIAILDSQDIELDWNNIKPIYRFLLTGRAKNIPNTKSFRDIKDEIKNYFNQTNKDKDLKDLLSFKREVNIDNILKNIKDKNLRSRLIYNNIVLLADKEKFDKAFNLFIKYRHLLVNLLESASLFMNIIYKKEKESQNEESIIFSFLSLYLNRHDKQLSPHQIDYILLFLTKNSDIKKSLNLAQKYNKDTFLLFFKEFPSIEKIDMGDYLKRMNKTLKKYSIVTNSILHIMIKNYEMIDDIFNEISFGDKKNMLLRLKLYIQLFQDLEKPHKKYKNNFMKLLNAFAMLMQNFPYKKNEKLYLELSDLIEKYIEYFNIDRFQLAVDTKAFFISISEKKSIKRDDFEEDKNDFIYMARKLLFEDDFEDEKYDFDVAQYDVLAIKKRCINALKNGEANPFSPLKNLNDFKYYEFKLPIIFDILDETIKLGFDSNDIIKELLSNLNLNLFQDIFRDRIIKSVNIHARKNIDTALVFMLYLLESVSSKDRAFAWYLKWIISYLELVEKYNLKKDTTFKRYRDHFLAIQEKKKFKSLQGSYKKIKDMEIEK